MQSGRSETRGEKAKIHPAAWLSFVLGLTSIGLCLVALTGIPAMVLGLRGLRGIHEKEGSWRGEGLAWAGMILGGLGTLATVGGVGAMVLLSLQEKSRGVECREHLRQIGVGLNKYADVHGRFPAATRYPAELPPERRLSWMGEIVGLLGEGTSAFPRYEKVAKAIDQSKGWDDEANRAAATAMLRVFRCPGEGGEPAGTTQYVGMAGINPKAIDLAREEARAGMFGHDRGVRREEVTGGISTTMMVLETARENGCWLAGGEATVRGLDPDEERYVGPGRPFGGLHHGVMQVLWVDGSVRPLSEQTPGELMRIQATLKR